MERRNDGPLSDRNLVALQAYKGQWVCAEGGGGGAVVANRNLARTWEHFAIAKLGGGTPVIAHGARVALKAGSGHWVCAEGGGGGAVVANRSQPLSWETFTIESIPRSEITLDWLHCTTTQDSTGADACRLEVVCDGNRVATLFRSMNDGHDWRIDQTYSFSDRVTVILWDEDTLDPDDRLGEVTYTHGTTREVSGAFNLRGAKYSLRARVLAHERLPH